MDLKSIYDRIDFQNKIPKAQPEILQPALYTRALWTLGNWSSIDICKEIKDKIGERGIVFDNVNARLHWTLLQFQTFPVSPGQTKYNDTELALKIKGVLDHYPPLRLSFRGIARTRFGLFMCGYPNFNVNKLRDELRALCPDEIIEPHPQDICHSTLFRFTEEPTPEDIVWLDAFVENYRNKEITTMRPDVWEFGYGTWTQKDDERIIISQIQTKPPHWILHRGLINGPDKYKENKESELWKRLYDGWEIEVDIWRIDGKIWLGHDEPTDLLENIQLLEHKNVWVHCKNINMLQFMRETNPGAHYFSHNVDDAVLTSDGFIWCYPGHQAGIHSIIVMPERTPDFKIDLTTIGGICSDYTFLSQ
jgi:hypothetical protein